MAQISDLTVCCGKVCRFLCYSFQTENTSDRGDETKELKQLRVLRLRNVESRNCNYLS